MRRLRPIRVLIASRDPRFLSVTGFLLARSGYLVETTRKLSRLLDLVAGRADVVVVDGSESLPAAARTIGALRARHPMMGTVLVAENDQAPPPQGVDVLPKWSPFERLVVGIERAYGRAGPRVQATPDRTPSRFSMALHVRLPSLSHAGSRRDPTAAD